MGLGFLVAAVAFQTFVSRYSLLLEEHTLFAGLNYVDDKIIAPGLGLTAAASASAFGMACWLASWARSRGPSSWAFSATPARAQARRRSSSRAASSDPVVRAWAPY